MIVANTAGATAVRSVEEAISAAALKTEATGLLQKEMFWGSLVRNCIDSQFYSPQLKTLYSSSKTLYSSSIEDTGGIKKDTFSQKQVLNTSERIGIFNP